MNQSNRPDWLRANEVRELLVGNFAEGSPDLDQRICKALEGGAFRCQARYAIFEKNNKRIRKRNWAIPFWLWSSHDGNLSLDSDEFNCKFDSPITDEDFIKDKFMVGVSQIILQGLVFHGNELREFFNVKRDDHKLDPLTTCIPRGRPVETKRWEEFSLTFALVAALDDESSFANVSRLYNRIASRMAESGMSDCFSEMKVRSLLRQFINRRSRDIG